MKIVVHIGTGKAGSTSIQQSLHHHRDTLLDRGILFPSDGEKPLNHRLLCEVLTAPAPKPPARALAQKIEAAITAHRPDTLVLSSEFICYRTARAAHLHKVLTTYSDDIHVLMYLREPLGYYRSQVQQQLKAQPWLSPPSEWRPHYLDMVSAWRGEFGDALSIVPFEKSGLHRGSVVDDVAYRYFPHALDGHSLDVGQSNVSEPAEVTALVQSYIAVNYPARERVFRKDVRLLREALTRIADREGIGTKAALRDGVIRTILARIGPELMELRDAHGIAFEAIDYTVLPVDCPASEFCQAETFADLCPGDPAVSERLVNLMLAELVNT